MELDALLLHYFNTDRVDALSSQALRDGNERLRIDFGVERDPGRRFALWTLLEALGDAPSPAEAFPKHPELRRAAEDYLSAAWKLTRD